MRPPSVTVIAGIMIVFSGVSLIFAPVSLLLPEAQRAVEAAGMSVEVTVIWAIVGGAVGLASGIAILKGLSWGRLLYLIFSPLSLGLASVLYGFRATDIFQVVFYVVVLVFLTRHAASEYFRKKAVQAGQ